MGVAAITRDPLDLAALIRTVETAEGAPGVNGAVVSFVGTVRASNAGREVVRLEYEAYDAMALRVFERIVEEARREWPSARVALVHRVGALALGEASIAIAAAAPHRAEAFAACRYTIERVKQIAPVWKHEYVHGGDVWIEGARVDPDDEAAREEALRRACV